MKVVFSSCDRSSKGAALMIVLALVVLLTGLALAYFSRTTTDRQLAQSSFNDTSADLLTRSALDIVVNDFKQEMISHPTVTPNPPNCFITPVPYTPAPLVSGPPVANLIRQSFYGDPTARTSSVNTTAVSANGRSISTTRWNSHYLIPRGNPGDISINPSPTPTFTAPDWVLVTAQGPKPTPVAADVIGRYAFAVYDEGGVLDMSLAGYANWPDGTSGCPNPSPTPWLVNVGRKGIVSFADLTALPTGPTTYFQQSQVDNIVGWRNYATTQRTGASFPNFSFLADCTRQDHYASYLLDFGDPPFGIDYLATLLPMPFTSAANDVSSARTDQAFMTRQELLRLQRSLGFSQNVLQYMGTFSRERNRPAPDWPFLQGNLSEGRYNLNNLDLVKPNPDGCTQHGRRRGWGHGNGRGHLCGTQEDIVNLFGLLWYSSAQRGPDPTGNPQPGFWKYIAHNGPNHDPNPNAADHIPPFRGPNHQNDFFQILDYALFRINYGINGDYDPYHLRKAFAIGASLVDQYDSDADDLDGTLVPPNVNKRYQTHTTVIRYGAPGQEQFAYGMETSDAAYGAPGNVPHRPQGAPTPGPNTMVINHAFSQIGDFGYGIATSDVGVPTLDFNPPNFSDAPVLDFFSYNPISSTYPRAGIVNLYTRNAPVIAALLKSTLRNDTITSPLPSVVVSQAQAVDAANLIVQETQNVLAGTPAYGGVTQIDLTRAIAGRLVAAGSTAPSWSGSTTEQKQSIARALAEMGQTRTWNLFIDVIAQTGRYAPDATNITQANKFIVEGEKRYWLHIALGRDLNPDGSVDVLGTQLEEVIE